MIKVNTMTDAQFKVFLPLAIEDYAQNIAANIGVTIEQAREDSEREITVLLPQGRLTSFFLCCHKCRIIRAHRLFVVELG